MGLLEECELRVEVSSITQRVQRGNVFPLPFWEVEHFPSHHLLAAVRTYEEPKSITGCPHGRCRLWLLVKCVCVCVYGEGDFSRDDGHFPMTGKGETIALIGLDGRSRWNYGPTLWFLLCADNGSGNR